MLKKVTGKREQPTIKDPDRVCVVCEKPYKAVSPLQKTCGIDCRRIHYKKGIERFHEKNPGVMTKYNKTRLEKDPDVWKRKNRKDRLIILEKLGGKCCVCGVDNVNWLHVDYIPTMRGVPFRHPRHIKWVLDHLKDFRILCANHHYELTITGKIEGSDITQ